MRSSRSSRLWRAVHAKHPTWPKVDIDAEVERLARMMEQRWLEVYDPTDWRFLPGVGHTSVVNEKIYQDVLKEAK